MTVSLWTLYDNMISDGSSRPTLPIVTKYADLSSVKLKFSVSISSWSSWVSGTSTSNLTYLQTSFIVASWLSQLITMHWKWLGWFFAAEWTWFPMYMFDLDRYFLAFWDDSDFTTGDMTETVIMSPGADQPPLAVEQPWLGWGIHGLAPISSGRPWLGQQIHILLKMFIYLHKHVNVTYSYVVSTYFWISTCCSCGLQYGST